MRKRYRLIPSEERSVGEAFAMAGAMSADDLLLVGKPREALHSATNTLKRGSGTEGASGAAAAAVQAARALGSIDEAGKALRSAFGRGVASLPSEALVLWCAPTFADIATCASARLAQCCYILLFRAEALEDAGRLEEAQEASDEALNRLGSMDRQLGRRAMRLSLVALAAEEGTVAAVDRSRKQLRLLDVHEEDRAALEHDLDDLESGFLEGFEESNAPESAGDASTRANSSSGGGSGGTRNANELDWLRALGQQQQQGQQQAASKASQQQQQARPVVLQQGSGGPQVALAPDESQNNQQSIAALKERLNQIEQERQQQPQQQRKQQQHSPSLPTQGTKGGQKQRMKEITNEQKPNSKPEQDTEQSSQEHTSSSSSGKTDEKPKKRSASLAKSLRKRSNYIKVALGGALAIMAIYSIATRKASGKAL